MIIAKTFVANIFPKFPGKKDMKGIKSHEYKGLQ